MRHVAWMALVLGFSTNGWATPQIIVSPATRVSLLELYTSEGCNTCPPAEEWISSLQQDPRLWSEMVPVTFHVDYWDYLGWRDPFDRHAYTLRQQQIAGLADSFAGRVIYTPQFVLDGRDWRGWFNAKPLELGGTRKIGTLSLSADGRKVTVRFAPVQRQADDLEAHVVLLAFGVDEHVGAGENRGVTLRHDFLVVSDAQGELSKDKGGNYQGVLTLPAPVAVKATYYALAGWVSATDDPEPLQAAGGRLAVAP